MAFNIKNYQFSLGEHRDKNVIFVKFPFSVELKNELKNKFPIAKWSATKKTWYLPDVPSLRKELGLEVKTELGKAAMCQIHLVNIPAIEKMREQLLLKGYSPNTIKTYCIEFSQLLYLLKDVNVDTLTAERLRSYLLYCTQKLELSENAIHNRINALKFYFEQVLHREKLFFYEIPRPKKRSSLPKLLSKSEVLRLFESVDNLKHLTMLKLCMVWDFVSVNL